MMQNIILAMVVLVPVAAFIWSVVSDAIESHEAYKDSLKGGLR